MNEHILRQDENYPHKNHFSLSGVSKFLMQLIVIKETILWANVHFQVSGLNWLIRKLDQDSFGVWAEGWGAQLWASGLGSFKLEIHL